MTKIITFSVAAYNVEQYLTKMCDSFLALNKNDEIEVLLIDDGSNDKTPLIAREYATKYPDTFSLITKVNGGHGSTINTGIQYASGKYFKAIDGDDWVDKSCVNVIDKLKTIEADMIITDYYLCYPDRSERVNYSSTLDENKIYQFEQVCNSNQWIRYHNVIYRTELLRSFFTPLDEHCFYVDTEFLTFYIPYIKTVSYIKSPVYCYRLGNDGQSVSIPSRKKHIQDSEKVAERLLSYYSEKKNILTPNTQRYLLDGISKHILWVSEGYLFFSPNKEYKKKLDKLYFLVKNNYPELFQILSNNRADNMFKPTWVNGFRGYFIYPLGRNIKKILKKR